MKPVCTIKKKYDPEYFVLILILIAKKKGYYLPKSDKEQNKCTSFKLNEVMVPLITYIYKANICFFCNTWEHPVCCNCLYRLHKSKCGCTRTEFFYNCFFASQKNGVNIVFCEQIKKNERIYYFW